MFEEDDDDDAAHPLKRAEMLEAGISFHFRFCARTRGVGEFQREDRFVLKSISLSLTSWRRCVHIFTYI